MITDATKYDLESIYRCAVSFFEYAGYEEKYGLPLDKVSFLKMVRPYIDDGICLLYRESELSQVRGGVCGIIVPWGYNNDIKLCMELFYWMDPDVRGQGVGLIKAYEERIKEAGARSVMVQPETELSDKIGMLYKRRKYQPFERFWIN
jgi:GNAT superfamily N-acetyltransferase